MSLKVYRKSNVATIDLGKVTGQQPVKFTYQEKTSPTTIWSLLAGGVNDLIELVSTSSVAGLIIPGAFILLGAGLLWQQIGPELDQKLKESAGFYNQGTIPLVADAYIAERAQYLSDPGAEYFRSLTDSALKQNVLREDPTSNNYSGVFYLTIPALKMERVPIEANVESGVESAYQSVLKTKLAHFKNTGLPISDIKNNIVIYGHSARPTYKPSPSDPASAFSFLSELKIGDEISIEMNGKTYKYVMSRSKIIEPQDVSIITGTPGRGTLTLFTCYPNGNNSHRYVAIARPVE